ncbi:MAG: PAS domain S-box protein [Candidatus Izemoplasmatales bacterium]|jgi:diguanylate cyclase (GGDEF)-like protein/PAS domain S-box-containing protein
MAPLFLALRPEVIIILYVISALAMITLAFFVVRLSMVVNSYKRQGGRRQDYMSLVDNYPGMAYRCLYDAYWTMKFVSRRAYEVTGYSPDDLIDNHLISFEEIIHPRFRADIRKHWMQAIQDRDFFRYDYQIIHQSGELRWVTETGRAVYDRHGNVLFVEGYIRDITKDHSIMVREKRSEAKYRSLIENGQIPILIDQGGIITYANPVALRMFRVDDDQQIIGRKLVDFLVEDYKSFYHERINHLQNTRLPNQRAMYQIIRLDGSIATVEVTSWPLFEGDEMSTHIFIYDLTERDETMKKLKQIQKRNRDLIVKMTEGIGVFDRADDVFERKLIFANRSFSFLLFGGIRRVIRKTLMDLFPMLPELYQKQIRQLSGLNETLSFDLEYVPERYFHFRFFKNEDDELIMMFRDITDYKLAEETAMRERNRLKTIIEGTQIAIWELDLHTGEMTVNERWAEMLGYTYTESATYTIVSWRDNIHPDDLDAVMNHFNALVSGIQRRYSQEYRVKHKRGAFIWVDESGSITKTDEAGQTRIISGTRQDITTRKEHELEIVKLSYFDALTGLYNRRKYEEVLISLNETMYLPLTLVMADVDALKITNDAFGHQSGDRLLMHVTQRFKESFSNFGKIFRTGGDEFIIILANTKTSQAKKIVTELTTRLENDVINGIPCSVSFGIATRDSLKKDFNTLLREAEMTMYNRKLIHSEFYRSDIISMIKQTLYKNCPEEQHHANLVKKLMFQLGKEFHLSEGDLNSLITLAEVHDIGKIAIEPRILMKSSPLTKDEWKQIHQQPEIGYRILFSSSDFDKIASDVLSHHERWDGTGYPRKLVEDEIPWKARFLSICEAYAAMNMGFPFRQALTEKEAANEIIKNAGTQFDPEVAKVFVESVLKYPWTKS